MASVVHCFTHAQMKDKMEGEELSTELCEDTGLSVQRLSLFSVLMNAGVFSVDVF